MTLRARFLSALIALFLGIAARPAGAADGAVALKWKFKPGQISRFAISFDVKMQGELGGQSEELTSKQTSDVTWVVDSIDDEGNARLTQTIERMRVVSSARGEEQTFDSDEEKLNDEGAGDPLQIMVNQPIHLTIDRQGKVTDAHPSEKLAEKLKQAQQGRLAAMFSRESLKQLASANTLELPAEPISRGSTWQQQTTVSDRISGRQTVVTTFRYDGSEERDGRTCEKISSTTKILPAGNSGAVRRVTLKDQKSNGVIWFDRAVGRVHEMQITNKIVREVSLGGNKLEDTVTTTTHMRLAAESD